MYTLPRNTRITIRDLDKPLRGVVARSGQQVANGRISVEIRDSVFEPAYVHASTTKVQLLDLHAGAYLPAVPQYYKPQAGSGERRPESVFAGTIPDGMAAVVIVSGYRRPADITFCINKFAASSDIQEELDVVRDAVLLDSADPEDVKKYMRLVRQALPKTWPLFLALIKKERTMLKGL